MAPAKLTPAFLLALAWLSAASAAVAPAERDVLQLGARLNSLEKELGRSNDKYLAALDKIRELEAEAREHEAQLAAAREAAAKREVELGQILRSYHLATVEGDVVPTARYQELVKANREKARATAAHAAELEKTVAAFQERLAVLRSDERELMTLTSDLEVRKKALGDAYLRRLEEKERREARRDNQRIAEKVRAEVAPVIPASAIPVSERFGLPLEQISSLSPSEKGITIKFDRLQPLRAPRAGRVVYNGELASYGKVLMIDHGDDIRSVMLGRFSSHLEKNAQVSPGDTLGYTDQESDSLYFEVRKKNVAQKTIHWLANGAVGRI